MILNHNQPDEVDTRELHYGKFDCPMAVYLYDAMLNGDTGDDEVSGEFVDPWAIRYGRRILWGNDRGFVTVDTYPNDASAIAVMDLYRDEVYDDDESDESDEVDDAPRCDSCSDAAAVAVLHIGWRGESRAHRMHAVCAWHDEHRSELVGTAEHIVRVDPIN